MHKLVLFLQSIHSSEGIDPLSFLHYSHNGRILIHVACVGYLMTRLNSFADMARRRDVVRIGCGAGFAGDRPIAALRLLKQVPHLQYLVLECLAERTLTSRYEAMVAGGKGYDPRSKIIDLVLLPFFLSLPITLE